ncbi:unnamed protein product, partial [Pylaiella littoralis]
ETRAVASWLHARHGGDMSLSIPRSARRKRARAAIRIQATYRGERTRNRVVQPALAAFGDVCDRISAECPGLTTESVCGPANLPSWLSGNQRRTTAGGARCATGACAGGADSAVALIPPVRAAAPRNQANIHVSDDGQERRLPSLSRPAMPHPPPTVGSTPVASAHAPEPPAAAAAPGRPNTTEMVDQEDKIEENKTNLDVVSPNTARSRYRGEVGNDGDEPPPEAGTQGVAEDFIGRHSMGRSGRHGASPPVGDDADQPNFRS